MHLLARQFAFMDQFFGVIVRGFETAHWEERPGDTKNSGRWILGHLVVSRRFLTRLAGRELEREGWEEAFDMGADPSIPEGSPEPEELLAKFYAAGELLRTTLEGLEDAACDRVLSRPFPDGSKTFAGAARFLHGHEMYHFGQLGLIRSHCGLPGFA
jgi:hypothetical protein